MVYGLNRSIVDIEEPEGIFEELHDSTKKILNYAGITKERADIFLSNLDTFRSLKDRSISDPETRKIRETISTIFFEVYALVLKKVMMEKNSNRLYQMFLIYGYMDEKLLKPDQCNMLYELIDDITGNRNSAIYNNKEWLEKIYYKEIEPSVNEFGQDYYEVFREKKKRGEVSDKDKAEYENNTMGRLKHEIDNLIKNGQRLCCGQINGYFPILHSGMIINSLSDTMVTPNKIEESLRRILQIDFSAFHREIVYNQPEKGIKKELIMKSVSPDFILMPTFGSRAVMWQELTGRVRNSSGRFIFPVFTAENIDDLMLEAIPKFRWELSKSMFSYARNEVGQNSLVGDYTNYLQFYKKNRELSDNAKQRVRMQMDKHRNSIGDVFASDYQTWINYESKGILRLNKVARGILFKHCPFTKSIRDNLLKHPMYSQLITRFENSNNKDIKVIEARYAKLTKPGLPLDTELENNLIFHRM